MRKYLTNEDGFMKNIHAIIIAIAIIIAAVAIIIAINYATEEILEGLLEVRRTIFNKQFYFNN